MSFRDTLNELLSRVQGAIGHGAAPRDDGDAPESNLQNGGFSGYRPNRQKNGDLFSAQSMQQTQRQNTQKNQRQAADQQIDYSGYTGYQPQAGADPVSQYTGQFGGFGAQPQQQTWQEQPSAAPQENVYAAMGQQPPQTPVQQTPDNISYMPNMFVGDDGRAYIHVERVAQVLSPAACFRVMEFMRNGESVIINTESIGNEPEVQRCLDMLSGAAFTLGCSMTRMAQSNRVWLIAPGTVLVMQDAAVSQWGRGEWQPEQQPQQQSSWAPQPAPRQTETYGSTYQPQADQAAYQQTAWQQPQQASWQPEQQQTTWQQPTSGMAYSSDTRKGVYATPRADMQ